ncbi:hypothetical protein ACE6H2_012997 [Prunus campanulata]
MASASPMACLLKSNFTSPVTRAALVSPKGLSASPLSLFPSKRLSSFTIKAVQSDKPTFQVIQPINGDPFIGSLETPVTSSPLIAWYLSNLPAYRTAVSPLLRGKMDVTIMQDSSENVDVSGVPKDMDSSSDNGDGAEDMNLSDENADGEDDTAEGGDDTEDHGSGSEGNGFYSGFNDGGDSSDDGGPDSLPVILVSSPEKNDRIGFVSDYLECGSVHALEERVKAVLRRELNKDTYPIRYFKAGPSNSEIEVDISGMSWGEVIESELQGAFVYEDVDPGHDTGASCSKPIRRRKQPTHLKDYYAF